jgi:hypothetical protein
MHGLDGIRAALFEKAEESRLKVLPEGAFYI